MEIFYRFVAVIILTVVFLLIINFAIHALKHTNKKRLEALLGLDEDSK